MFNLQIQSNFIDNSIRTSLQEVDESIPLILDNAVRSSLYITDSTSAEILHSMVREWISTNHHVEGPEGYFTELDTLKQICDMSGQGAVTHELSKLENFLRENRGSLTKVLLECKKVRLYQGLRDNYLNN